MSKLTCTATTTLVAGLLIAAPATSALAASPADPPTSSSSAQAPHEVADLTVHVDSYDTTTHVAKLSGSADWYTGLFSVSHKKSDGTTVNTFGGIGSIDFETNTWSTEFRDVFAGDTFVAVNGFNTPRVTAKADGAVAEPKPTVTTSVSGGVVNGLFTFARHGLVEIRDGEGRVQGGTKLADNWNAPAGTPLTYRFTLPDTGKAATYTVAAAYGFVDHTTTTFTVNDNAQDAAPAEISQVSATSGERAVVTATGEKGAAIKIMEGDKVVGVKVVGSSGKVTIPVPIDDEAVNDLKAVQTITGQTPTTDAVEYVAAPQIGEVAAVEDTGTTLIGHVYVQSPLDAERIAFFNEDGERLPSTGNPNSSVLQTVRFPYGTKSIYLASVIDGVLSEKIPLAVTGAEQNPATPEVAVEKVDEDWISLRIKATPKLSFIAKDPDGRWFDSGKILPYTNPAGSQTKGTLLEIPRDEFTGNRVTIGTYLDDSPLESEYVTVTIPGI